MPWPRRQEGRAVLCVAPAGVDPHAAPKCVDNLQRGGGSCLSVQGTGQWIKRRSRPHPTNPARPGNPNAIRMHFSAQARPLVPSVIC